MQPSDERPSWSARRADALGRIAESFLQHGSEALSSGDRHQIVVHVDAETLRDGGAGRSELEDGPSLAVETVRRLACDASIVRVVENEQGEPLDVGRKTRSIPPAIRRALNARDRGCRFPGCSNTRYVDAHHIHHWAHGGETKLSNLVQLRRFHHRQVHEGSVVIQYLDDGALRFVRPDGRSFDSVAPEHSRPLCRWRELPCAMSGTVCTLTKTRLPHAGVGKRWTTGWRSKSCFSRPRERLAFPRKRVNSAAKKN